MQILQTLQTSWTTPATDLFQNRSTSTKKLIVSPSSTMRTEVEIPSPPKLNSHDNNNQKPKQGTKAHPPNLTVNPAHVCVGSILWLLPDSMAQEEEREILCNRRDPHSVGNGNNCNSTKIRPEGWDHPVLVLDIKQRSDSTTLGDIVCTVVPVRWVPSFQLWGMDVWMSSRRTDKFCFRSKLGAIRIFWRTNSAKPI